MFAYKPECLGFDSCAALFSGYHAMNIGIVYDEIALVLGDKRHVSMYA